ncbi:nuclear transport factor 2 family protein [Mycobacterium manitobense]|uniref:Nuclear transport factor 2 family protein n=1 Tax=[Mycobacterium] manitobense TaxID=190147 RepID=A0A9X2YJD7_9MYCO|nr:nuclear transport factor 2 family protein [[Mycobacterium] manitobense]MCV7169220.1 nuclear transport factor 2 family protein [[Mycobacterium] manitobense]
MDTCPSGHPFITRFADFWDAPSPARLPELLHPNVVLRQPLARSTVGITQAQRQFERFCRCLPGLHARIDHWVADGDDLFIEFTLHADFGRDTLTWPTVNRLVLRDGKAIERVTYFDPLAVLPTLLRHPSVWWQWLIRRERSSLGDAYRQLNGEDHA